MRISTTVTMTTPAMSQQQQQVTTSADSAVMTATTSDVKTECDGQMSVRECEDDMSCAEDGYAKDESGCNLCSCDGHVKQTQPPETVYHVVAAARKSMITQL